MTNSMPTIFSTNTCNQETIVWLRLAIFMSSDSDLLEVEWGKNETRKRTLKLAQHFTVYSSGPHL